MKYFEIFKTELSNLRTELLIYIIYKHIMKITIILIIILLSLRKFHNKCILHYCKLIYIVYHRNCAGRMSSSYSRSFSSSSSSSRTSVFLRQRGKLSKKSLKVSAKPRPWPPIPRQSLAGSRCRPLRLMKRSRWWKLLKCPLIRDLALPSSPQQGGRRNLACPPSRW